MKNKGFSMVSTVGIILLIIVAGIYWWTTLPKKTVDQNEDVGNYSIEIEGHLVPDSNDVQRGQTTDDNSYNTIVDCGKSGPEDLDTSEVAMNCFRENFKKCNRAKFTSSLDMGTVGGGITYYYEIVDSGNGLCSVKSKFITNPNSDWVGKEMVCKYDNSKSFDDAIQDMSNCSGELYKLMTG